MPLTCNIDKNGRWVRLVYGIVLVVAGAGIALLLARPTGSWLAWCIAIGTVLAGAFGIFEAWAGWCVMRAAGVKTPM